MPYIFNSKITIPSKLFPGVTVTYRKMTENRRGKLQGDSIDPNTRLRQKLRAMEQLREDSAVDNTSQILRLNDEIQELITKEINPIKIAWGVSSVRGLQLEDEDEQGNRTSKPATMDNVGDWPSSLIEEVLSVIDDGTALSETTAKNSESSSTTGEAASETENSITV